MSDPEPIPAADPPSPLDETLAAAADGWRLIETGWSPERAVAVGSNFMVGNGYLGYRGTSPEQGADRFVALVVSDTYDCADGRWRELATAPNPLFVAASADAVALSVETAVDVQTWLDLAAGEFGQRTMHRVGAATVAVTVERFASYDDLHLLAQRWTLTTDADVVLDLEAGIDADIWSLNGVHLPTIALTADGDVMTAGGSTVESGVEIGVAALVRVDGVDASDGTVRGSRATRSTTVSLSAGSSILVDTIAAVCTSRDGADPLGSASNVVTAGADAGHDGLRAATRDRWRSIWADLDVRVDGDVVDQASLRFSAYHNRICTPAHTDHLPVGARGLSCQAYQGAAFWDQEVYNLGALLFTEPEIARSLLVYRHRTLDGARRKAARLGYDGAYYAWISGDTGDELCPDVFFTDVLTGRPIRNHFNVWQMHVSPDIVTTIARYVEVTGDVGYLLDHGAEIAFEVARFLRSFVRYDDWRGRYHCIRLLGPDEWHENVDDNAFTNHQTRRALEVAIDTYETLAADHPARLIELAHRIGLDPDEVDGWRKVRDHLVVPGPDDASGLIEQFDGFFELEDIGPGELRERLLDPAEYWGWPNGIAVPTQVSKQADVVMLLWLHGDRFDEQTAAANYRYYEPRCSHNSSLSHTAHGMVAIRIGEIDRALGHFRSTARVDLLNTNHAVVGGTFIGGIHTAACGGAYQLAVNGFGGLSFRDGRLAVDPALPDAWQSLSYPVAWRGQRLTVTVGDGVVELSAAADNADPVTVAVHGVDVVVDPGAMISLPGDRSASPGPGR